MQDFTFGTLSTIDKRLARQRLQSAGLVHLYATDPLDPLPGHPLTVHATVGASLAADHVALYYTLDGREPQGRRGVAGVGDVIPMTCAEADWDLIDWGYGARWQVTLPGQPEGTTVRYKIGAWRGSGGEEYFADNQATDSRLATRFAVAFDRAPIPDWVWDASIYFIFLDRFYPGDGKKFLNNGVRRGFSGGTLRGVIDKLDYVQALGANCIWLSPCFAGPEYHGYHTTDYLQVEPRWGTNQDLLDLVRLAHEAGIRVLLDFVPNHTSHQHPFFLAAQRDRASEYVPFYTFNRWPDDYEMFYTSRSLPKVNLEHQAARQWMIDAARYWLEVAGIDGYRLDHALGPSHNFWTDFRAATRAVAPASFTVGEVTDAADVLRSYTGRLDGILDFLFLDAARRFFAFDTLDAASFDAWLTRHDLYFGAGLARPTFLDNHDMNRFLWTVRGDKARLRLAALCQFTLAQPPITYYGTEVGMGQARDKRDPAGQGDAEARRPMVWDERQDRDLLRYYQTLHRLRRDHVALRRGERISLAADTATGVLAYAMRQDDDAVIVALNNSPEAREVSVPLTPILSELGDRGLTNALNDTTVTVEGEQVTVRLGAREGTALIPTS